MGELLDDLRDERKLAADTKLLLQPIYDPNERKRKPGERMTGRDGRMYELCELRVTDTSSAAPSTAVAAGGGGEAAPTAPETDGGGVFDDGQPMDDLQLGSIAAVREWRLLPPEEQAPSEAVSSVADGRRSGGAVAAVAAAATTAAGEQEEAEAGEGEGEGGGGEGADGEGEDDGRRKSRRPNPKLTKKQRAKEREEAWKEKEKQERLTHLRGVPRAELPGARIVVTYAEQQKPSGKGGAEAVAERPSGGKELVGMWIEVHWPLDKIWYRAQVRRHHSPWHQPLALPPWPPAIAAC